MNKQEALFFEALSKDRSEIADVLERRAVRGYKDSVVEKYSDQAHFIYELLQNADDACATNARFILEENRLIFAHNGTRHFSVSNPANEDIDSERKTLGDINAITSIANSNKTGASIGKFGVGFKAVFQYTSTPHIYDPSFKFKIERFIVPIKLDTDFPGRRADETLFVFPFDHQERDAEEAYNDISDKLKNLSFPLLFLTNLKGIEFEFGNVLGLYDKRIKQTITYENTTAEHIVLTQNDGDELYDEELWFTFEYVSYLSRAIAKNNPGELFKIGVIAPYRAQADMIDKLLASEKLPKEVDVQVGTIHGFQGDECDIIFAVFNTPPTISASKDMFLNKRNIINVSISRARDYLFVVMPDDDTDNISNLRLVKRVESLIQSTDAWNEFLTPDLEELMFGDAKYLENNAFSTSHQSVNVYGLPEKIYEVRTEDTAVDVQIHRSTSKKEEVDPTLASGTVVVDEPQYMDSYDLDESLIPEELRDTAIDLPVRGAINGWCYLVPYEGKLKSHTVKKVIGMFIPQNRNGQEKMVSVSVVKEDRIIYISKDMFKIYEQSLSEPDGIQLKRTFF